MRDNDFLMDITNKLTNGYKWLQMATIGCKWLNFIKNRKSLILTKEKYLNDDPTNSIFVFSDSFLTDTKMN